MVNFNPAPVSRPDLGVFDFPGGQFLGWPGEDLIQAAANGGVQTAFGTFEYNETFWHVLTAGDQAVMERGWVKGQEVRLRQVVLQPVRSPPNVVYYPPPRRRVTLGDAVSWTARNLGKRFGL